ncbi:MAG: polymer-forming cytoskeletal protein [Candidatus Methylacidiphilales bacterium]|nr:polymer-forming cytoskeletal protein [Candidatus Methylacidiphilales bacterium]
MKPKKVVPPPFPGQVVKPPVTTPAPEPLPEPTAKAELAEDAATTRESEPSASAEAGAPHESASSSDSESVQKSATSSTAVSEADTATDTENAGSEKPGTEIESTSEHPDTEDVAELQHSEIREESEDTSSSFSSATTLTPASASSSLKPVVSEAIRPDIAAAAPEPRDLADMFAAISSSPSYVKPRARAADSEFDPQADSSLSTHEDAEEAAAESPTSMNDKRITLHPSETYRPAAPNASRTYGASAGSPAFPSASSVAGSSATGLGSHTSTEHAVLSADTEFRGALAFSGSLEMNGRLEGTIDSEDGTLTVGEDAVIKGEIRVHNAVVYGKVQGNITASGRIELRGPAQVFGDLRAMRIVVEEGVVFVGRSDVLREAENRADFSQIFSRLSKRDSS